MFASSSILQALVNQWFKPWHSDLAVPDLILAGGGNRFTCVAC